MKSGNLARRLDRLEAELAPPSDEPGLTIEVEFVGSPERNKIVQLRKPPPPNRRGPWLSRANRGRGR